MARMMIWHYPDRVGLYEQDGETLTKIDERDAEFETTFGFKTVKVPSDWGDVQVGPMAIRAEQSALSRIRAVS